MSFIINDEKNLEISLIIKKSIGRFSLEVSLNELINNQSETKTKIDSQIKFCPKITKNRFKVQRLKRSSLLLSVNMDRSKA